MKFTYNAPNNLQTINNFSKCLTSSLDFFCILKSIAVHSELFLQLNKRNLSCLIILKFIYYSKLITKTDKIYTNKGKSKKY